MNSEDINEAMRECAKAATIYSQDEMDHCLTSDISSIYSVEKILGQLHEKIVLSNNDPIDPETVVTLSNLYGGFLGELFRLFLGGEWRILEEDSDAPSIVLSFQGLDYPFPSRVFHRLLGGEHNNVATYFNAVFNDCVSKLPPGRYVDTQDYRFKACRATIVTE